MQMGNVSQRCYQNFMRNFFQEKTDGYTNSILTKELIKPNLRAIFIKMAVDQDMRDLLNS